MEILIPKSIINQRAMMYDCVDEFNPCGCAATKILLVHGVDFNKFTGMIVRNDAPEIYVYQFED